MFVNNIHSAELNSPYQKIKARVEFYKGSTLEKVCNCGDMLSDFTVEKTGEGKFFGFGICQKLRTVVFDVERELNLTTNHTVEASFGVNDVYAYPFPNFYIKEIERDEANNQLTITAYDSLYRANDFTVSQLNLTAPYTIKDFVLACSALLDIPIIIDSSLDDSFSLAFESGANFEGTENIRQALNAVAEATQTIYYIDNNWDMVFKRLKNGGSPVLTVQKSQYLELINGGECVLSNITHTTELGDSVSALVGEATESGVTQYIRDNPFWELREDIGTLLDNAQAIVGGTTILQFECTWVGNYLLEIGDKIGLVLEDNSTVPAYVLDDTIVFDGTLSQVLRWTYDDNSAETAHNPTSLGDALNKTYARVDKVNKRIDLVVSDTQGNTDKISQLTIDLDGIRTEVSETTTTVDDLTERVEKAETNITQNKDEIELRATKTEVETVDGKVTANTESIGALQVNSESISASVQSLRTETEEALAGADEKITTVTQELSDFKQTSTDALLSFQTSIEQNGVTKVETETGFLFNQEGLTISKSDSEMETKITEDGMTVYKNNDEVLIANNEGVKAEDLHATTYLIIGSNSRFENFDRNGEQRTACFWIGT